MSGAIAIAGALIGGSLTGLFTLNATTNQISAENDQQVAQFFRQEKQTAYNKLIVDSFNSNNLISGYAFRLATPGLDRNDQELNRLKRESYDAMALVAADYRAIQLTGEGDIVEKAKDVWTVRGSAVVGLDQRYQAWIDGKISEADRTASYDRYILTDSTRILDEFTEMAHEDLKQTR